MEEIKQLISKIKNQATRRRIGLALSGGGAYGIAHVGVLKFLEEIGLPVDLIVGTSAGALVGGLWASGISSHKMYRIAKQTDWWFLAKPVIFKSGLMDSSGIEKWVNRIIGNKQFSDLDIEFVAVATDFSSGELVVLDQGNVGKFILISCTVPGIYQPINYEERVLVDGGLVQNLPVQVCRSIGAEIVISVDLHCDFVSDEQPNSVILSLIRAATILQRQHELLQLKHSDIVIKPKIGKLSQLSFKMVDEFVSRGYEGARQELVNLKQVLLPK